MLTAFRWRWRQLPSRKNGLMNQDLRRIGTSGWQSECHGSSPLYLYQYCTLWFMDISWWWFSWLYQLQMPLLLVPNPGEKWTRETWQPGRRSHVDRGSHCLPEVGFAKTGVPQRILFNGFFPRNHESTDEIIKAQSSYAQRQPWLILTWLTIAGISLVLNGYSRTHFPAVQGGSPWARDFSSRHQRTCGIVHDTWRAGECISKKCISRMENIGKWKMASPLGFSAETWCQATQAWWVIFKGRSTQILRTSPVQTVHRVHRVHRVLRRSHRHFTCHPSQRSHGFFGFCSFKPFWARRRQKILATPASPCPAHVSTASPYAHRFQVTVTTVAVQEERPDEPGPQAHWHQWLAKWMSWIIPTIFISVLYIVIHGYFMVVIFLALPASNAIVAGSEPRRIMDQRDLTTRQEKPCWPRFPLFGRSWGCIERTTTKNKKKNKNTASFHITSHNHRTMITIDMDGDCQCITSPEWVLPNPFPSCPRWQSMSQRLQ